MLYRGQRSITLASYFQEAFIETVKTNRRALQLTKELVNRYEELRCGAEITKQRLPSERAKYEPGDYGSIAAAARKVPTLPVIRRRKKIGSGRTVKSSISQRQLCFVERARPHDDFVPLLLPS